MKVYKTVLQLNLAVQRQTRRAKVFCLRIRMPFPNKIFPHLRGDCLYSRRVLEANNKEALREFSTRLVEQEQDL